MGTLLWSRTSVVWMALVGATAVSWGMGHGVGLGNPRHDGVAMIVIAFVKVRFVILDFMEIRHAPVVMRGIAEAWAVVMCVVLVVFYLQA